MTTIGRYEVQAEIARGAMGAVYRVLDPLTGQVFALKLLAGVRVSDTTGRRLQREAQALTRLRHPNVVAIHEIGEDRGKPFLVLDMIEGEDLEQRITRGGPLSSRDAAELFLPLAQALGYAHQSGVLHRDLKPANVLIARATGRAFLGDFGLAKDLAAERSSLTVSGQMMGTPGYWPPEQASGDLARVGPASDVYGLGATLYAALTGEPPISGGSLAELLVATIETRPPLPSKRVPGVDPDLEAICMRCLEKDPGDRYPSASALATDLERYLRGEALADAAPRGSGPPLGLLVGLGVVLIAVLSAGVIVLARGSGSREGDLAGTSPRRTAPSASPNVSPTPEVETAAPRHSRGLRQPTPTPRATPFAGQPRPTPTPRPTLLARPTPAPRPVASPRAPRAPTDADRRLAKSYAEIALSLGRKRRLPDALDGFTKSLELVPDDVETLINRGLTLAALKQLSPALKDLDRAVALAPKHLRARCQRGRLRGLTGDPSGGIKDLTLAISQNSKYPEAYLYRGEILAAQKEHQRAHDDFNLAKNNTKKYSSLYYMARSLKSREKKTLQRLRGER